MDKLSANLRPCVVLDGIKGYFHRWGIKAQPAIGGVAAGQIAYIVGIVEHEDGTVGEYRPNDIRFTDRQKPAKREHSKAPLPDPPRWAPENEIEEACMWITKTVKSRMWPCGPDGEKACDALCKQCWEKWKENANREKT